MTTTGSGKASPHWPALPDDIVSEILSWIPPKILWRFRIVSISWYNQIAHPSFIKKLKSNFRENFNYFPRYLPCYLPNYILGSDPCDFIVEACNGLSCNENEDYFPSYPCTYDRFSMIVGSCNGLLCYSNSYSRIYWEEPSESRIYLHNPSTKKTIRLPRDPFSTGRDSACNIRIGLCYDESNHDFKVVIIPAAMVDYDVAVTISIYSLKNNSWERVKNIIPRWISYCYHISVGLKETIYWHCTSTLIAFDSSKLACRVIPYPDKDLGVLKSLTVVKGSIWIMESDHHRNLCAWMMIKQEGDNEIWEKKFKCYIEKEMSVLTLSYQGRILLRDRRRKLVTLDPETKKEETISLGVNDPFLLPKQRDKGNLSFLRGDDHVNFVYPPQQKQKMGSGMDWAQQ